MTRSVFMIACLTLVCAPGAVRAASPAEVRVAIQAQYNQFDRAYARKDFKSVGKVFTTDCVLRLKDDNRSMSAPRVIQGMLSVSKALTVSHAQTRIVSVTAQGDKYEVSAVWTGDSVYVPAKGTQDDKPRSGKTRQAYHDTWRKTKNGWQIAGRIING